MILWVDAHISPSICRWIRRQLAVDAVHVRDLGLREAEDPDIFGKARKAQVIVFTKDEDFVRSFRAHFQMRLTSFNKVKQSWRSRYRKASDQAEQGAPPDCGHDAVRINARGRAPAAGGKIARDRS